MELAFRAALGSVIPAHAFPAALVWWRFYTFYIYIVLGAIVAGGVALRAVRKTDELEEELDALQGVKKYPARVKCALLPWTTLRETVDLYRHREPSSANG